MLLITPDNGNDKEERGEEW